MEDIFAEADRRGIKLMSITDHDSVGCQARAMELAGKHGIDYITGIEMNITFKDPELNEGKDIALDFLGYGYDIDNEALKEKLKVITEHRLGRAKQIMDNINAEFDAEGIEQLTEDDMKAIEDGVDGTFGRPHIANYLVKKGIVSSKQEGFDRYLVKCDVPKYPVSIEEASRLIHDAGGKMVMAHPNDPNGTSLVKLTADLNEQTDIIEKEFLRYIDGVECWHSRNTDETTAHYIGFASKHGLLATGGTDCHQNPPILGTIDVPDSVATLLEHLIRRV
jgi:predicted metal-dependent phosphoesterase TrpH